MPKRYAQGLDLKTVWESLGDDAWVTDDMTLGCDWSCGHILFEKGADVHDIWHWIEETWQQPVAGLLYTNKHTPLWHY